MNQDIKTPSKYQKFRFPGDVIIRIIIDDSVLDGELVWQKKPYLLKTWMEAVIHSIRTNTLHQESSWMYMNLDSFFVFKNEVGFLADQTESHNELVGFRNIS